MADTATLVGNPRNPQVHPPAQVDLLARIIAHAGWRSPIVVSKRSGFVVAGHGRLLAARKLGLKTVPINDQSFATEADEWAHLLADNRLAELAETDSDLLRGLVVELKATDMDLDLTGFDVMEVGRISEAGKTDGENDPQSEYAGMPAFENGNASGLKAIVHFENSEDMVAFEKVISQKIPLNTLSLWFPKKAWGAELKGCTS